MYRPGVRISRSRRYVDTVKLSSQTTPNLGIMSLRRHGPNAPQIPLWRRPHSSTLFHSQQTPRRKNVPRIPPELRSAWHSSSCKRIMVFLQTRPSEILRPLLHCAHPKNPLPPTIRPRLHQSVRHPPPAANPYPAGPTGVLGHSPGPSWFKFSFLY